MKADQNMHEDTDKRPATRILNTHKPAEGDVELRSASMTVPPNVTRQMSRVPIFCPREALNMSQRARAGKYNPQRLLLLHTALLRNVYMF